MPFPALRPPRRPFYAAALLALAPLACSCAAMPSSSASNKEPAPAIDRKLPATPDTRAATP